LDAGPVPFDEPSAPLCRPPGPPEEAVTRCSARTGDALKDPTIIRGLHRQFADLGALSNHALDTTGLVPEAVADAIDAALEGNSFRLHTRPVAATWATS
jgi:hypothetical protein